MGKRAVKADPNKWSRQSRQSFGAYLTKEYVDIPYFCWRCGKPDVFTAEDQKHSFEVKKNYFWQRRLLCQSCWQQAIVIKKELQSCQKRWASSKPSLQNDKKFLSQWLELLTRLEQYVPYRPDSARKAMLAKLIKRNT